MIIGNNPPDAQIEEVILEKIRFGIQPVMSASLREQMTMTTDYDIFSDTIIRRIRAYLLGNKVNIEEWDSEVEVYPSTMWEELKNDFAPKWIKKRWPVRYSRDVTHHIQNQYHVCPHLDVPKQETHLRYLINRAAFIRQE